MASIWGHGKPLACSQNGSLLVDYTLEEIRVRADIKPLDERKEMTNEFISLPTRSRDSLLVKSLVKSHDLTLCWPGHGFLATSWGVGSHQQVMTVSTWGKIKVEKDEDPNRVAMTHCHAVSDFFGTWLILGAPALTEKWCQL